MRPRAERTPDPRTTFRGALCIRPSRASDPGGVGAYVIRHRFSGPPGRSRTCDRCGLPDNPAALAVLYAGPNLTANLTPGASDLAPDTSSWWRRLLDWVRRR